MNYINGHMQWLQDFGTPTLPWWLSFPQPTNLSLTLSCRHVVVLVEDQLLEGPVKGLRWAIICIHLYSPLIVFSVKTIAIKTKTKTNT